MDRLILSDGNVYVNSRPPPPPEPESKPDPEHQSSFGFVFANELARPSMQDHKRPKFLPGSIIVRERLSELSATVPDLLVVMLKRAKGFNKAANDWEFLMISGDGKKIISREKKGACYECHRSHASEDFVFRDYPYPR